MTTIDQKIAELLSFDVNGWPVGNLILVFIALVLSVVLCGAIGIEREWKGRSAGLRTHLLVGVGSCIIMIISIYGFPALFENKRDVARLAASVITGVGFLGAGTIVHRGSGIKGLTTAATIWIVMAIGLACGSFNFVIAIASTLIILFVLVSFQKVEAKINERNPVVVINVPKDTPILQKIMQVSKEYEYQIQIYSTEFAGAESAYKDAITCTFRLNCSGGDERLTRYLAALEKETEAYSVRLINSHK